MLKSIQPDVAYLHGLTVKQESYALAIDVEAAYTMQNHVIYNKHGHCLCKKHRQLLDYIDRPLTADWVPDLKEKEIHLKPGRYIVRGNDYITLLGF